MQLINNQAKPPAGHYSSAVVHNGFVFLSGVLPACPGEGAFAGEAGQVLTACADVLALAGCDIGDVVHCTAYIVGIENWPEFNKAYADFFGDHKPARTVLPMAELRHGSLVELQMVAALKT